MVEGMVGGKFTNEKVSKNRTTLILIFSHRRVFWNKVFRGKQGKIRFLEDNNDNK